MFRKLTFALVVAAGAAIAPASAAPPLPGMAASDTQIEQAGYRGYGYNRYYDDDYNYGYYRYYRYDRYRHLYHRHSDRWRYWHRYHDHDDWRSWRRHRYYNNW